MLLKIKTVSFILIISSFMCCCSCTDNNHYLQVTNDYIGLTKMVAGEVDTDMAKSWYYPDKNPYIDHVCNVSVQNGVLHISDKIKNNDSSVMFLAYGYFVGVNLHDEGWVGYYPWGWLDEATPGQMTLVARESCFGFLKTGTKSGYIFTYLVAVSEYEGYLYSVSYSETDKMYTWTRVATFDDIVDTYLYDSEAQCIYIFTIEGIEKYSITDGTLTNVITSSILKQKVRLTSAVLMDGKIYGGSPMGVYEYELDTGIERWYPMDYSQYIDADANNSGK